MEYTTESVCVKISNLRKLKKKDGNNYTDLEDWMNTPGNIYVGRRGRIFIHDKETGEKKYFGYPESKYANPFNLKEMSLDESLTKYKEYLINSEIIESVYELKGLKLGCFCERHMDSYGNPLCHAQVLVNIIKS